MEGGKGSKKDNADFPKHSRSQEEERTHYKSDDVKNTSSKTLAHPTQIKYYFF
jgi:hypothetical protein